MKHIKLLLSVISVFWLASCEYSYPYRYTLTNSTDTSISVHIKSYRLDSIYQVYRGEKIIIYETDHGIEGSKGPYFQDVTKDLTQFTVKKGVKISSRNYLQNSSWFFEKGEYSCNITNAEF